MTEIIKLKKEINKHFYLRSNGQYVPYTKTGPQSLNELAYFLKKSFPLNGAQQRQKYTRANSVSRERSKLYDNTSLEDLLS